MKDAERQKTEKLRVINIGLDSFYRALTSQDVKVAQIQWRPPVKRSDEIMALLDQLL